MRGILYQEYIADSTHAVKRKHRAVGIILNQEPEETTVDEAKYVLDFDMLQTIQFHYSCFSPKEVRRADGNFNE